MFRFFKGVAFAIVVFFAFILPSHGQSFRSGLEVGAQANVFIYQGDLSLSALGSYNTPGFGISLFGGYRFNPSLSVRANLALGNLKGDDAKFSEPAWRKERNINFKTSIAEVSGLLVWDFTSRKNNTKLTPYLFAGIGYSFLDVKPDYEATGEEFQGRIDQDQAYPKPETMLVIPVGGGLRYALSENLSVNTEGSYRLGSQTDYLDGISLAGSPAVNDFYYTISVGVIYSFNGDGSGNKRGGRSRRSACPAYR